MTYIRNVCYAVTNFGDGLLELRSVESGQIYIITMVQYEQIATP